MGESKILGENEKQANKIAAKVMRITFFIFILVYLLNVVGVFIVDQMIMTIAFIGGSILLLLPTLLVNVLKKNWNSIKYINVLCSVIFVTLLSITLTFHVVVIYVYPIAIASLYFSKRLNIVATAFTVIGVSIGQVLAFVLNTLPDDNFTDMNGVIIFGVIPRALILIAVAAIFTMLSQRTASMLSNLMGAEEQEAMLNRMKQMQENATLTFESLVGMIKELGDITDTSLNANQRITEETERLLQGSMENATEAENSDGRMQTMTGQIQELSSMNNRTAALAEQIGEKTLENQGRMNDATSNMEEIYGSTEQCKAIISNLGEQSKEIVGIVETITAISGQTKVLALNASIEAARAGESGRGFAVVAEEIQKLSQETQNAVESIGTIITQVTKNTEEAVVAMEKNVLLTQNGMESIQKANESTTQITSSNEEMVGQILSINKAAEAIKEKSSEVSEGMKQIADNAQLTYSAVEHVTAATQENAAGTESLAGVVEQIKELSEKLRLAVQGK